MRNRQVQSMTLRTNNDLQTRQSKETLDCRPIEKLEETATAFLDLPQNEISTLKQLEHWAIPELETHWLPMGQNASYIAQIHEDLLLHDPKGQAFEIYTKYGVGLSVLPRSLEYRIRRLASDEPKLFDSLKLMLLVRYRDLV